MEKEKIERERKKERKKERERERKREREMTCLNKFLDLAIWCGLCFTCWMIDIISRRIPNC